MKFLGKLSLGRFVKPVLGTLIAAGVVVFGALPFIIKNSTTEAADCSANAVVRCGANTPAELINKIQSGNGGTQWDLAEIFRKFGSLPESQYDNFTTHARHGHTDLAGNVYVDGRLAGTNAMSLGRLPKATGNHDFYLDNGTRLYYGTNATTFAPGTQSIPVMVYFNAAGQTQSVIMYDCGNPVTITRNDPVYSCNALNVKPGADSLTYNFSANVNADNGATFHKLVYDFGDGQTYTSTNFNEIVTHKYAKEGSYTASLTYYVNVPGNQVYTIAPAGNCVKTVKIDKEPKPSVSITKLVDGQKSKEVPLNTNFTYSLKVTNTGNIDLAKTTVTDKAPANVKFISTDKGSIANNSLVLTNLALKVGQSTTINITAQLTKYVAGAIKNTACVDIPETSGNPDDCDDADITTPRPSVKIDKVVNGKEIVQVKLNEKFTYTLKVTNDGKVDLTKLVVTDKAPAGIQFLSVDKGSITNNSLSYTIPSLKIGQSETINITAKATKTSVKPVINTACVDTPDITGNPDDCDDASTTTPEPNKVTVCDPNTREIIAVDEGEESKYEPVDSDKCAEIKVCVIDSGDQTLKPIFKDQLDPTKHSTNVEDCNKPPVVEIPSTGIEVFGGLFGSSAVAYGAYAYASSRRALRNLR